jgi:NtrC-family two-component system response regulator AlgB
MDFLVIDDDKTFRDATCLLIEDEGHHAESAATGEIGLQTLKDDEFDAVLLDLNLGDENGLDVLQQLVKSTPDLPVVMFTAQGNVASAVEATFWRSRSLRNNFAWCSPACSGSTK